MRKKVVLSVVLLNVFGWVTWHPRVRLDALRSSDEPGTVLDASTQTILIQFGVTDKDGRAWTGSLQPQSSDGEVVSLAGYHFEPPDRITNHSFQFTTRPWTPGFEQIDLSPALPGPRAVYPYGVSNTRNGSGFPRREANPLFVFPNGVYASVKGSASTRFRLRVGGDSYSFTLSELSLGKQASFAGGNIRVELVPNPWELTSSSSGEADYPALTTSPSGKMAVVWQEYAGDRDRIVLRQYDGALWSNAEVLETAQTHNVFRPVAAFDGKGRLHVLWSAMVNGNWGIYERAKTTSGWQPIQRLTDNVGSNFNQRVIADARGDLWLAWQGFRGGQSDIFLKHYTAGKWGEEIKVSESVANDWEPSLAVTPDSTVWVGWDSYDRGNYDVFVRSFGNNVLGPIRAVTHSPRFEAHTSLASDSQGRLWIGFDEAEANWGKDYGYLVMDRGNPLYQSRRLRFVRLTGEQISEPEASVSDAFPLVVPDFVQNPQIQITRDGKLVVVAQQLSHANRVLGVWGASGVWEVVTFALDATGWKPSQVLPASAGGNDVRYALASDATGQIWTVWAEDARGFATGRPERQTIHIARLLEQGGREITMKPFVERPELSLPVHLAEPTSINTVRGYRIRTGTNEYGIMSGDLNRHTAPSGDGVGDGSLWDFYRYMLDAAGMDFSTVTDHQGGATAYDWWKTQKSTDLFFVPGRLTTLYAYERSVPYPNGHHNIAFAQPGAPILPIDADERLGKQRSSSVLWPYLQKYNGVSFPHTSATEQGTDWKEHSNRFEPLVEIYQGHRVSYEHEGAPKAATYDKLYLQRSGYRPDGYVWNALARGYRMGFEAASDHTSTHLSYSCMLTENDSREAVIDAMRKRHAYGATDNMVVDFRIQTQGKEYIQGDEVETSGPYTLVANLIGTGSIWRVDVIQNEHYVYELTPAGKNTVNFTYIDPHPVSGENRYYVRLLQEDGNVAWSSPIWVNYSGR